MVTTEDQAHLRFNVFFSLRVAGIARVLLMSLHKIKISHYETFIRSNKTHVTNKTLTKFNTHRPPYNNNRKNATCWEKKDLGTGFIPLASPLLLLCCGPAASVGMLFCQQHER